MPVRFIATAWPGEYGPNVVMHCVGEELAQPLRTPGGVARDGVLGADRAALLDDLARRVEPRDAREPGALEPRRISVISEWNSASWLPRQLPKSTGTCGPAGPHRSCGPDCLPH